MVGTTELRLMGDEKLKKGDIEGGVAAPRPEKRGSVIRADLGWRRYLGVVYTMLSTNAFSLSSTILKKYSHISP